MKINSIARIVILAGIMTLPACGMKVGFDDATINAVECTINNDCKSSDSSGSSNSSDNNGPGDTTGDTGQGNGNINADNGNSGDKGKGAASDAETVTYQGTRETDQETSGGIGLTEPEGYNRTSDRLFLGTFKSDPSYRYNGASCFTLYNLPSIVRAYSHLSDPFIDFETSDRELAWAAELYEDGTFDFSVNFLDKFGHPSVDLDCTCEIVEGYSTYTPDEIQCSCAGGQGSCLLYYDMM